MLDPAEIDRRLQSAALPWRASEARQYIIDASGMEIARFSDRSKRDLVVEVVNGLAELMGRIGAMEASAEDTDASLLTIRAKAIAALEKSERATVEVTALQAERDALAERLAIAETREAMALRQVADVTNERGSARAIARVLAHAYESDNRPPQNMVREALAFPVTP